MHCPCPATTNARDRNAIAAAKGCVETWLSGPAFQAQYAKASGSELRATDIAEAAATGEEIASECLERYCDRLARSLANVVNLLDPHVIVLGGGLSKIPQLYERVPELWKDYIFSERDSIATQAAPAAARRLERRPRRRLALAGLDRKDPSLRSG